VVLLEGSSHRHRQSITLGLDEGIQYSSPGCTMVVTFDGPALNPCEVRRLIRLFN